MTHWPRSWNYPEDNEDDEMSSMGRQQAEAEEKLMLMQDAAEEMYDAIDRAIAAIIPLQDLVDTNEQFQALEAIRIGLENAFAKAEGRS